MFSYSTRIKCLHVTSQDILNLDSILNNMSRNDTAFCVGKYMSIQQENQEKRTILCCNLCMPFYKQWLQQGLFPLFIKSLDKTYTHAMNNTICRLVRLHLYKYNLV